MGNYQLVKQAKESFRVAVNNMFPALELENETTLEALDDLLIAGVAYEDALCNKLNYEIKQ